MFPFCTCCRPPGLFHDSQAFFFTGSNSLHPPGFFFFLAFAFPRPFGPLWSVRPPGLGWLAPRLSFISRSLCRGPRMYCPLSLLSFFFPLFVFVKYLTFRCLILVAFHSYPTTPRRPYPNFLITGPFSPPHFPPAHKPYAWPFHLLFSAIHTTSLSTVCAFHPQYRWSVQSQCGAPKDSTRRLFCFMGPHPSFASLCLHSQVCFERRDGVGIFLFGMLFPVPFPRPIFSLHFSLLCSVVHLLLVPQWALFVVAVPVPFCFALPSPSSLS